MQADQKRELNKQLENSHGSFELVLSPLVLGLIGLWLDSKLGTTPLMVVVLSILGLAGAVVSLFYRYQAKMEMMNAERSSSSLMNAGVSSRADHGASAEGSVA